MTLVELYNTTQAAGGRDNFGAGNKFITPLIVNGKVYVGTTTGVGVFGLLSDGPDGGHSAGARVEAAKPNSSAATEVSNSEVPAIP